MFSYAKKLGFKKLRGRIFFCFDQNSRGLFFVGDYRHRNQKFYISSKTMVFINQLEI